MTTRDINFSMGPGKHYCETCEGWVLPLHIHDYVPELHEYYPAYESGGPWLCGQCNRRPMNPVHQLVSQEM